MIKKVLFLFLSLISLISCNQSQKSKIYREISDLDGETVAVLLGSVQDNYAKENLKNSDIMFVDDIPSLFLVLESGKCDAVLCDKISALDAIKSKPSLEISIPHVFAGDIAMGFSYDNLQLRDKFNQFLDEIKESGLYNEIVTRWTDDFTNETVMPDIPVPTEGTPIRIGNGSTAVPFEFIKDGEWYGLDIELMKRFGVYINQPIEFSSINFGGLIAALASNKIDIIASDMTVTEERAKQVAFSNPYYNDICVLVSRKTEETQQINSINDLKDCKLGVLLGSSLDIYATKNLKDITILRMDDHESLQLALKSGQCDAMLEMRETCINLLKKNQDFKALDEVIFTDSVCAGFNIENTELCQQFNRFVAEIKNNGTWEEMRKKWLVSLEDSVIYDYNVPLPAGGKPLRVGLPIDSNGFSFLSNNKQVGFEPELVARFAAHLNRPLEIYNMNFSGLIPALISNKVDIILSTITITPERANKVLFSNSYSYIDIIPIIKSKEDKTASYNVSNDIGVMTGSLAEMYIQEHLMNTPIKCFDNIMDAIAALQSNKIGYVMTAYTTAVAVKKNNPNIVLLNHNYTNEGAVIGFGKGKNEELREKINQTIETYKANGQLQEIIERWTGEGIKEYTVPEIPIRPDGKILRVATAANREPMCFVQDGQIVGLDAELIQRIAYDLGYKVEFQDMQFSALIAAITTDKADVIISNFTATEERAKAVDFSHEYFVNPQIMMYYVHDNANAQKSTFWDDLKESFYNNLIHEKRYKLLLDGFYETLIISFYSILLGTLFGALVCFLRMRRSALARNFAKGYINLMRGIPMLVFLMIMFYVIFAAINISATVVAIITFGLVFAAYVSEMFRTAIEGVDKGQTEAGIALGFTKVKTFIYIVAPQAIRRVIPVYKGELISLIKNTSIVGYIAIQDLTKASDIIRSRTFDAFFPLIVISIIYFILAWLAGKGLDYLNAKTSSKKS